MWGHQAKAAVDNVKGGSRWNLARLAPRSWTPSLQNTQRNCRCLSHPAYSSFDSNPQWLRWFHWLVFHSRFDLAHSDLCYSFPSAALGSVWSSFSSSLWGTGALLSFTLISLTGLWAVTFVACLFYHWLPSSDDIPPHTCWSLSFCAIVTYIHFTSTRGVNLTVHCYFCFKQLIAF